MLFKEIGISGNCLPNYPLISVKQLKIFIYRHNRRIIKEHYLNRGILEKLAIKTRSHALSFQF